MSYYQILENILTMNGYCNEPNNIFQKKDIKAIPYLQKMVLQLPKLQKCEIKQISSNDDFDKGIDKIIGFTIDEN